MGNKWLTERDLAISAPFTSVCRGLKRRRADAFSNLPAVLPAAASAAITAAIATTTTAAAIFLGAGFIDIQRPSIHVAAIETGNGLFAFAVVAHFHEAKPAGAAGVPVGHDVYAVNSTIRLKQASNGIFRCIEAEITYENIFHLILLSGICRAANAGGSLELADWQTTV